MKCDRLIFGGTVVAVLVCMTSMALSGVEPSPFHERLDVLRNAVVEDLRQVDALGLELPLETQKQIAIVTKRLLVFDVRTADPRGETVLRTLETMYRLSSQMISPKPEPPGVDAIVRLIGLFDKLTSLPFASRPELTLDMRRTIQIMDGISRFMLNPQLEAPSQELMSRVVGVFDKLAMVGFTPQPEPPGRQTEALGLLSGMSALMFTPQPEPPGDDFLLADMVDIVNEMASLIMQSAPMK